MSKEVWDMVINHIEVTGGTESLNRSFYSGLYRTCERMINFNEDYQYYSEYY
ncbi:MAG: glycoside hydrolase family 92 protein [Bacteroidales bacterium]|jgi:putative alpha-1,2-mannosidase|nr:glycoside hydrolase family 92 protein [Bacteroidales bacterium]